jgi:hypothetical protein
MISQMRIVIIRELQGRNCICPLFCFWGYFWLRDAIRGSEWPQKRRSTQVSESVANQGGPTIAAGTEKVASPYFKGRAAARPYPAPRNVRLLLVGTCCRVSFLYGAAMLFCGFGKKWEAGKLRAVRFGKNRPPGGSPVSNPGKIGRTGRVPNTDMLDLSKTGLVADARGFLPVNDHLETSVPGIYATGDVNGRFMLQHAAAFEVHYLRQKLLKGTTEPIDERHVAHAVFSYPEITSIGFTEDQPKADATPYVAVFEDWLASARAEAMRIDYPRIKRLVSPTDYSILGCHLVGPESATLLHQVMMLMRLKNDVRELANMIHIHPAINEYLLAAAVKTVGEGKKHPSNLQPTQRLWQTDSCTPFSRPPSSTPSATTNRGRVKMLGHAKV